jgi:hypothetical protein
MIKKALYWIIVVVIVGGAVYSYQKVGFGRKTAMLFQTAFGDANSMGGPGGGPPGGGRGPEMNQGQAPGQGGELQGGQQAQGGAENQGRGFQPGGEQGGRPPQGGGPGGRPGGGPGGGIISVRNVIPYTFIFAFFALFTCVIENFINRLRMKG